MRYHHEEFILPKPPKRVTVRATAIRVNLILAGTIAINPVVVVQSGLWGKIEQTHLHGFSRRHFNDTPSGLYLWSFMQKFDISVEMREFLPSRDIRKNYHRPIVRGRPIGVVPIQSIIVESWAPLLHDFLANPSIDPLARYRRWSVPL